MSRALFWKLAALGGVCLVLLVVLGGIGGLVQERQQRRDSAVADMAQATGQAQQLFGPLLVLPIAYQQQDWTKDPRTGVSSPVTREVVELRYVMPEQFRLQGQIGTTTRQRGIYELRAWQGRQQLTARFAALAAALPQGAERPWRLQQPWLAFGVSDPRGIGPDLALQVNGQAVAVESGTRLPFLAGGVHAPLPAALAVPTAAAFELTLALPLQGSQRWSVVPVGRDSRVSLAGDWPHPAFDGDFLPTTREVTDAGFRAEWATSHFATNLADLLTECAVQGAQCRKLAAPAQGVSFIDPVDQYLRTERAIKYAVLFIGLTFATFFLLEVLQRRPLHPVQYALVGLSLALFFLLLLSLAEHIGFGRAYLVSALAGVALQGYYLRHMLGSRRAGLLGALGIGVLHGVLYTLIGLEDYALLAGSLLMFSALAAVMVLTRKVDWNAIGRHPGDVA